MKNEKELPLTTDADSDNVVENSETKENTKVLFASAAAEGGNGPDDPHDQPAEA